MNSTCNWQHDNLGFDSSLLILFQDELPISGKNANDLLIGIGEQSPRCAGITKAFSIDPTTGEVHGVIRGKDGQVEVTIPAHPSFDAASIRTPEGRERFRKQLSQKIRKAIAGNEPAEMPLLLGEAQVAAAQAAMNLPPLKDEGPPGKTELRGAALLAARLAPVQIKPITELSGHGSEISYGFELGQARDAVVESLAATECFRSKARFLPVSISQVRRLCDILIDTVNAETSFEIWRYGRGSVSEAIEEKLTEASALLSRLIPVAINCHTLTGGAEVRIDERSAIGQFLTSFGQILNAVSADVAETYRADPAATSRFEVRSAYTGITALILYRCAHVLYKLRIPLLPRMMTEYGKSWTGADIHPGAKLAPGICIDHGDGLVIGETAVIYTGCRLYQNVTIGAANFDTDENGEIIHGAWKQRHPTLEALVTVYSNATIIGGDTVIGAGSVVGANTRIERSLKREHLAYWHDGKTYVKPLRNARRKT